MLATSQLALDLTRIIQLVLDGLSLGLTVAVVWQAWKSHKNPGGPPRLLFWHICFISAGTQGMVLTGAAWSYFHLEEQWTPLLLPFLASVLLVDVALFLILGVQRDRVRVQQSVSDVEASIAEPT